MADSNYYLFFKLYRDAPAMGAYLMDYCVDRLRKVALTIMTKVRWILEAFLTSNNHSKPVKLTSCTILRLKTFDGRTVQAFRPVVPLSAVFEQLGFEDMSACEAFLTDPKLAEELSIEFIAETRAVKKK